MKKSFIFLISAVLLTLMMTSCETEELFDETLLEGKWKSGTLYYRYFANGNGYSWDEGDDVNEAEAQDFTWTLQKTVLTHIHILEIGATVPKVYTVTELTETSLKYKDDFGKSFSFIKVN